VDPRGNIKQETLEQILNVERAFNGMEELHREYGFESALLKYSIHDNPIQLEAYYQALFGSNWTLVYWDDLSLLYVRRNGPYANLSEKFSYEVAIPAGGFEGLRRQIENGRLEDLERELTRNSDSTGSALSELLLGQALAQAGRLEEATRHLEAAAARNYQKVEYAYHASMGYIYQRQGRTTEAAAAYETALDVFRDAGTMENLASVYQHTGREKLAIGLLEEILEQDEHRLSVVSKLAILHRQQGNTAKAEHFRKRMGELDRSLKAKEDFERGMKAYVRKDYDEALRYLNAALKGFPESPEILSNLGYIWFDRGDYQQALLFHQRSIAADPRHANGYYGAAQAYKALGYIEKARKHWEKYIELVPRGPFVRRAREEMRRME
jgi:tetratricopeptide (TPR) repeat protein